MMKVLVSMALVLMLCMGAVTMEKTDVLDQLAGRSLEFSSGAGAWDTTLVFGEGGAFAGNFHDSEMGEMGEDYPYGTVYTCLFHGKLEAEEKVDEWAWKLKITELEPDADQEPEIIEDGIRFVLWEPYGLREGQEVILYLPGTPVEVLPEDFMPWSHLMDFASGADKIPYFAIWNEAEESGFVSYPVEGFAE